MALWGLGLYFLFILLKLSSWIYVLKIVLQQLIKRYFDSKDKALNQSNASEILSYFENNKIHNVDMSRLKEFISAIKDTNTGYVHQSDIKEAIEIIRKHKK